VGIYTEEHKMKRAAQGLPHPDRAFIQGPYANIGVAKGQCTYERNLHDNWREDHPEYAPLYDRIIVEVTEPNWKELEF